MRVKIYTDDNCPSCSFYMNMLKETQRDLPELEVEIINAQSSPIEREIAKL